MTLELVLAPGQSESIQSKSLLKTRHRQWIHSLNGNLNPRRGTVIASTSLSMPSPNTSAHSQDNGTGKQT
ncbi:hypothetical protein CBS147339_4099 [Penicillium roqueforti]|nr:hypothetical protein DTO012A8_6160 [Penicillium roqueforti]KAI3078979.1 hypothetical protein CBS147339_4099 [Penicillium roqueforti]KAI3103171.1 hypothetical protein CBS147338_2179 [Penicillium roqueforti]KAI3152263.1 hypothetical protein CBS147325_2066 [Penicillium roqueforti]KAI3181742.1 hypothetical protein DTO046C5_1163 [Penicillium roqueforti]